MTRWKRPSDVMAGQPRMIGNVNPYSIKQDLITDCSFVASLCIASAFERRFHKQLITGIIHPQVHYTTQECRVDETRRHPSEYKRRNICISIAR